MAATRTQRWRMIIKPEKMELYDIANDPYQDTNVARQHPEVVQRLSQSYDKWWEETLPLMINEDAYGDKASPQVVRYNQQKAERGIPDWVPPKF